MNAIAKITDIHTAVAEWKDDLTRVMASDVSPEKFIAAVTTALTMNPEIVQKCTAQSIKTACIKAAYDGLRPDGKEGALVAYGTEATWMPMVFGVRKKAKDHDDIIITAREVREKDHFEVIYGLREDLIHNPDMSSRDRGPIVATYAVFRKGDEVLHFEVMTAEDIDKVRAASKSSNSPAWRNWYGEMGKKAAVNRGSKSVPMSDAVRQVIDRDNDLYDLDNVKDVTPSRAPLSQALAAGKSSHNEGFSLSHVRSETGQAPMEMIDSQTGEIIETKSEAQSGTAVKQTPSGRKGDEPGASAKPSSSEGGAAGSATGNRPQNSGSPSSAGSEQRASNAQVGGSSPSASTSSPAASSSLLAGDKAPEGDGSTSPSSLPESSGAALSRDVFRKYATTIARFKSEENVKKGSKQFFEMEGITGGSEKESALFRTIRDQFVSSVIKGSVTVEAFLKEAEAWIAEDVPEEKL